MTDIGSFLNTTVADAPDASLYATGAKVRFQITRTTPVTVGDDQKPKVIFRLKPVEVVSWPEAGENPVPTDVRRLEPISIGFMLTEAALANSSTHISAKKFIALLELDPNQSWKSAFEQSLGQTFVALIRRKPKWNNPEEDEPVIAAVQA
jgi:hypothetical protein